MNKVGYYVDIVETATGKVVKRLCDPPRGKTNAEKVEAGVIDQLDHENYHTELTYFDGIREHREQ